MAKPKKDGTLVSFKLNNDILSVLNAYSDDTGVSKTKVVEKALTAYLKAFITEKERDMNELNL